MSDILKVQGNLNSESKQLQQREVMTTRDISGLEYYDEFLSLEEEEELLETINSSAWNTDLSRRTQHYGYKYPYFGKLSLVACDQIPSFLEGLLTRVSDITSSCFDQVIINEYTPGQGIRPHIDTPTLFGEKVVSISLGSDVIMNFDNDDAKVEVNLKRRSAVVLTGDSRYVWKHSIATRKSDHGIKRSTRISVTFRKIQQESVISQEELDRLNATSAGNSRKDKRKKSAL